MAFGSTKRIACSLAFAAMLSSPAMAADHDVKDPGGLILSTLGEIAVGFRDAHSTEDGKGDGATISGSGRVSIPFGMNFSVQLDGEVERHLTDDEEDAQGVWLVGGHASLRDPNLGLLGIFGAVGEAWIERVGSDPDELGLLVGGEVQAYLDDFTLYGQGGYADFEVDEEGGEGFVEGWFVRGVGRWFITPDMMVEAEVSYGETDLYIDGFGDGEFWNWGVKGKMRILSSLPIYGVLAYRGGDYDAPSDDDTGGDHVFLVGVSVLFGPATLKKNDRLGATLDMPLLPGRAAAWTEALD